MSAVAALAIAEPAELTPIEHQALALSEAALLIDAGRLDQAALAAALDRDLDVWVAIRTLIKSDAQPFTPEIRANLAKLGDFVIGTIFRDGLEMAEGTIDTLININLQISEGLLETQNA